MGKHVFTFTTISNDVQQMDLKTNVMATNGARASFYRLPVNLNGSQFFSYVFLHTEGFVFMFFISDPLGIISEYCASLLFLWCLNRLPARELLSRRLIPTKEPVHRL